MEILLVEDNASDVRLTQEAFESVDFDATVHASTSSSDALEFLTERAEYQSDAYPDMLLLDLNLPGSNGFAVLEGLRDAPNLPPLPVLVLTSSETEEDVNRSYELSASAYITKPTGPDEYVSLARAIKDFWFERAHLPPE